MSKQNKVTSDKKNICVQVPVVKKPKLVNQFINSETRLVDFQHSTGTDQWQCWAMRLVSKHSFITLEPVQLNISKFQTWQVLKTLLGQLLGTIKTPFLLNCRRKALLIKYLTFSFWWSRKIPGASLCSVSPQAGTCVEPANLKASLNKNILHP